MSPIRTTVMVMATVAVVFAFSFVPSALAGTSFITGTASFTTIDKLSPHADMHIELLEQPPNLPQRVATRMTVSNIGKMTPPYNFALPYDDTKVFQPSNYILVVTIAEGRQIRYRGSWGVLKPGQPNNITIQLQRSTGYLPKPSAGGTALLIGLVLAAMAGAVYVWRQRRHAQLIPQLA